MFRNLKVSARLALGFGIVSILLAAVILLGIRSLAGVSDNVNELVTDKYPKVVMAHDLIGNITTIAIGMRNIVIFDDAEASRRELATIETERAQLRETLEKLKKVVASRDGQEVLQSVVDTREQYRVIQEEFLRLVAAGKRVEARDLLVNKLEGIQTTYIGTIRKLIAHQDSSMAASGKAAEADYVSARNQMILLGSAAVLLGIGMAFWITLSLTRTLGGEPAYAAELLKRIADGDLSGEVSTRKGDTTSMLFAVSQMVGKLRQVIAGQRAVIEAANRGDFAARVDTAGMAGFQKEMGDGLNQLVTTTGASIDDVVRVMSALAEGDLTTRIDKEYHGAFGKLKEYSNGTMDKLAQVVGEVNSNAQSLASASEEVSATAQSLSQAASEQAASVEETSASLEQMTASISQNTE
ncbi:MAG TPA: MCP four helix bundle domain-containing protein, partial [Pseudoduganella sp.]